MLDPHSLIAGVASPAKSLTTLSDESPAIGDVSSDLQPWKFSESPNKENKRRKE